MKTFHEIMKELEGKESDIAEINKALHLYGNLAVKIALLGIAATKRLYNPWWIGCPPSVFLSYKWNGPASRDYVEKIHDYLTRQGYRVFFDRNELDENANTYTEVPEFISKVAEAQYYLLVLTEKTADYVDARHNKTSWIFDEYQQAVHLVNAGRLILVPLLVEENGATAFFTKDKTIDVTANPYDLSKLDAVFWPVNFKMDDAHKTVFSDFLDGCDVLFVQKRWNEVPEYFKMYERFKNFPDYQFRLLIYCLYNDEQEMADSCFNYVAGFIGNGQVTRLTNSYRSLYKL
jgi:TIR domain